MNEFERKIEELKKLASSLEEDLTKMEKEAIWDEMLKKSYEILDLHSEIKQNEDETIKLEEAKYNIHDIVGFRFEDRIEKGTIVVVDYGTFDNPYKVSYDIMVEDSVYRGIYKHILEENIINKLY